MFKTSRVLEQAVDVRFFAEWQRPAFTTNRNMRMHVHMGLVQQALGLRDLHVAELGASTVKRRITGAGGSAQLFDCHAGLSPLRKPMIRSSVSLLFFISVILLVVDGPH